MLLNIWNNMRGYVEIETSGFAVERFINLATHSGIYIWDVTRNSANIRMKVSVKAFRRLKPCAKKTKTRIKIVDKRGLPFLAHRYRKRKILVFGALFFIASLYLLSSFVWLIGIEGTNRIDSGEITAFLAQNDLKIGSFKPILSDKKYEELLIEHFKDIAWIDMEIKGTRVTVRLTETIPKTEVIDTSTPADIIADRPGLIVSVATSSGTPKVKQGDVVKKGDLLVSSEVLIGTPEEEYTKKQVHASAVVTAKLYYDVNLDVKLSYTEKKYTGKVTDNYSIMLFGNKIGLFNRGIIYECFDKTLSEHRLNFGKNYPLPVVGVKEQYSEFVNVEHSRSVEQAKELANLLLEQKLSVDFPAVAEIVDKNISFTEYDDRVELNAVITTIESIGITQTAQPGNAD